MNNKDENQECLNEDAEAEKALSLKKSNNAGQHFVHKNLLTNVQKVRNYVAIRMRNGL